MFEEETIPNGVTIKVYRFPSPVDAKPIMSFMVRMSGPQCDQGNAVIGKTIQGIKTNAKRELDFHKSQKPKKISQYLDPKAYEVWGKKMNQLSEKYGNPLFDFTQFEGEELLHQWAIELQEAGLTQKTVSRKSNGDLDEEVLNWS